MFHKAYNLHELYYSRQLHGPKQQKTTMRAYLQDQINKHKWIEVSKRVARLRKKKRSTTKRRGRAPSRRRAAVKPSRGIVQSTPPSSALAMVPLSPPAAIPGTSTGNASSILQMPNTLRRLAQLANKSNKSG